MRQQTYRLRTSLPRRRAAGFLGLSRSRRDERRRPSKEVAGVVATKTLDVRRKRLFFATSNPTDEGCGRRGRARRGEAGRSVTHRGQSRGWGRTRLPDGGG